MTRTIKSILVMTVFSLTACTSNNITTPDNIQLNSTQNGSQFKTENEYGFSTMALSQSYLTRKFKFFINKNKGINIIKEIKFGNSKHPDLLRAVFSADSELYSQIIVIPAVSDEIASNTVFSAIMQELGPSN